MAPKLSPQSASLSGAAMGDKPNRPHFSDEEIRSVTEGIDGVKSMLPARCYHDSAFYEYEVEHVLKKNWLCIGRWDWAEKPGDYFTIRMFGEPLVIVRDRSNKLHALINSCQHRWSQVVPEGKGNTKLLVCPNHSWTYELDGRLRGVAMQNVPHFNIKNCRIPELRLEQWMGFVFINFDDDAAPLGPQLAELDKLYGHLGMEQFKSVGRVDYQTSWNYKFSFETGYEAYHHEGVHKDILSGTSKHYAPIAFGDLWGVYGNEGPIALNGRPAGNPLPFGPPPWLAEDKRDTFVSKDVFVAIYPNLITYITPYKVTYIVTQFESVAANKATTANAYAPWVYDHPDAGKLLEAQVATLNMVCQQDLEGCRNAQRGIVSSYNRKSVVHPLESQLSHYYSWMMQQYLK